MSAVSRLTDGRPSGTTRRRRQRPAHWLLAQLPPWMREDDFFARFTSVFEVIATTHLEHVDQLEHVFDLTVAPPVMVRALGRCVGVDVLDPALDEALQREVLLEMAALARLSGTRHRLTRVLEIFTRAPVEVVDSGGVRVDGDDDASPSAPHVRIAVESVGWMDEDDLVELVRRELPVSVTFELFLGDRCLWPEPEQNPSDISTTTICPQCGASSDRSTPTMDADEFCRLCDFPLFWAPGARRRASIHPAPATGDVDTETADQLTVVECPSCEQITELEIGALRTAGGFCPGCDFPLWWATRPSR